MVGFRDDVLKWESKLRVKRVEGIFGRPTTM